MKKVKGELRQKLETFRVLCEGVADRQTSCHGIYHPLLRGKLHAHCVPVAIAVQARFGGEVIYGKLKGQPHYWNRFANGTEADLTSEQFRGNGIDPLTRVDRHAVLFRAALREMAHNMACIDLLEDRLRLAEAQEGEAA